MKKSKKNTPRPRWYCPKCKMLWVNCEPVCIICGVYGTALNESAEKLLRKQGAVTHGRKIGG